MKYYDHHLNYPNTEIIQKQRWLNHEFACNVFICGKPQLPMPYVALKSAMV